MYIGKVFLDKVEFEFQEMDTEGERRRHLERLTEGLLDENITEVNRSGVEPVFYVQQYSIMNAEDFNPGSWTKIIKDVGSEKARSDLMWLVKKLNASDNYSQLG